MNIQPHFEELFELLEKHGVDYLVVEDLIAAQESSN